MMPIRMKKMMPGCGTLFPTRSIVVRNLSRAPGFLATVCVRLGVGCLDRTAHAAPQVQFPGGVEADLVERERLAQHLCQRRSVATDGVDHACAGAVLTLPLTNRAAAGIDLRPALRLDGAALRTRLGKAQRGRLQVRAGLESPLRKLV